MERPYKIEPRCWLKRLQKTQTVLFKAGPLTYQTLIRRPTKNLVRVEELLAYNSLNANNLAHLSFLALKAMFTT